MTCNTHFRFLIACFWYTRLFRTSGSREGKGGAWVRYILHLPEVPWVTAAFILRRNGERIFGIRIGYAESLIPQELDISEYSKYAFVEENRSLLSMQHWTCKRRESSKERNGYSAIKRIAGWKDHEAVIRRKKEVEEVERFIYCCTFRFLFSMMPLSRPLC